ncbi:LPS O-antigen length regulator [Pseudoalteromonas distincta]|jgi:uncharacterized protein involved in exopolysaccharide biosynthesis|uniref:Wzz/FepE/Etk N-terminal domain-containing protein n=1 Tax=Pseudoalteromonas TaxID=53246 RepID=UPI00118F647A|nr:MULTISPECIES: Wzz/FepE/Etk N-terminal domain-containing protein [Pseudoalteromonas]MBB1298262.1 LPS O-antigen length regulator [Pseudoalteromonas sp. SR41-7]TVU70839.1 LPS O-antigen length regulator [Pseudoalteromonas elyakovii]|tara:strand:- start:2387 stop:3349 length:963 start_codon:yes stop_codon:yes gene_type:complete
MENKLKNPKQYYGADEAHNIVNDEVNLREIFSAIWQGKWTIIVITTLFSIASVFYAINQDNIYKSEALLAPAEQDKSGGIGSLAGQFGGLANLAGINLGSGIRDKTQMALEVLKSRKFITQFIQKHNLLPDLMAVESWDLTKGTINYNPNIYNSGTNTWLREVKAPKKAEPSMQEAYKEFTKIINIADDKETGMITLAVEHKSPVIAQQWVNWLIHDINAEMKTRDVAEANKSADFLTQQLEQTKIADIRTVLYKLIEEQTKTIMFANVRDEYVFKTIDPAIVAEEKFKPKRAVICILGAFLGAALAIIYVLFGFYSKRN